MLNNPAQKVPFIFAGDTDSVACVIITVLNPTINYNFLWSQREVRLPRNPQKADT
jgi:hypothetical protein